MTAASSSEERDPLADARSGGSVAARALGNGNTVRYDQRSNRYYVSNARVGGTSVSTNLERDDAAGRIRIISRSEALTLVRPPATPPAPVRSQPRVTSTREERPTRSTGGGAPAPTSANGAGGFTLSPETLRDINAAAAEESSINTNLETDARTSNSAFNTGTRTTGTFNIGRFRSEVSGADSVLPTHSFLVVFAPMLWTRNKFSSQNLDSLLTMRCDNVVLPSVNLLQEQNIRRYGFGPVENVAYGVNVGDFTLQFIVDKSALVVEFFEEWLNTIVNRDSFGGAKMNSQTVRQPYEIAYKDTYNCPNVNVFVYDRAQNAVMEYNIYDVFPTGIQSMNMSWSEENNLMKLNISFSFTDLRIKRVPAKEKVDDKSFKDEIVVTARRNPDGTFSTDGSGSPLNTLNSFGGRNLELTSLSNETTIIGDFAGRIRGSVPAVVQPPTLSTTTADVPAPKDYSTLGVRINIGA